MKLTATFQKVPGGYVGFVEQLPGANAQGRTLAETRRNLAEAVELVLDASRRLAKETRGSRGDLAAFDERAGEPLISFEALLKDLKRHGKI